MHKRMWSADSVNGSTAPDTISTTMSMTVPSIHNGYQEISETYRDNAENYGKASDPEY